MTFLEVTGVSKAYSAEVPAVRDVSLNLERGEILCLLGPSGCGKTTLLRLIAGLERPDRGEIRFDGRDMGSVPPHEREFGMMFQDFALFPHKNVRDNVAFGLRMQKLPAAEITARVTEALDRVDLKALAGREIAQLSGGEQQRVALARALAPGPRLLMLDEPLGALDRALRERLMIDVRAILKRVGMTAIYVTHDQTEAFAVGDRLVVMNAGEIEQVGLPKTIFERPATPFVAQFVGFQNLVPGRVNEAGEIETAAGIFRPDQALPIVGKSVTLLVKPVIAGVEFHRDQMIPGTNRIEGVVEGVTFRGRYSQIRLKAGEYILLFEESGDLPFHPGDAIQVSVSPDQLLVYESSLYIGSNPRN